MDDGERIDDGGPGLLPEDLSDEAKEPFQDDLTKAQASLRIEELQQKTGRGNN